MSQFKADQNIVKPGLLASCPGASSMTSRIEARGIAMRRKGRREREKGQGACRWKGGGGGGRGGEEIPKCLD